MIIIGSLGKTTVYSQPSDGEAQPQRQHFQPGEKKKTISKVFQTKLDSVRKCHDQSKGDPRVKTDQSKATNCRKKETFDNKSHEIRR